MYYAGTVVLGMSEAEFWRCTPRKLYALIKVHIDMLDTEKDKKVTGQEAVKALAGW